MKKILAIILFLFLGSSSAYAYDFPDVTDQNPHRAAIEYLSEVGVIEGQGDSLRFDPDGFLNRAEWSVIMNRAAGSEPSPNEYGFCFPDVTDDWFAPSVCFAQQKGWIKGYQAGPEAGMFIPTNNLNVAEVLVTLQRQHSWVVAEDDVWFSGALAFARAANLVDPSWAYNHPLTRAEAAEVLFRTIAVEHFSVQQYDPLLADLLTPSSSSSPSNPSGSSATVTLKPFPDMPAKAMLAKGSLYVPVLRFTLESDKVVTLNQLTIRRISIGRTSDLLRGRLMINGRSLQERPFMNTTSEIQWSGLQKILLPGEVFLVEMNVDFIPTAQAGLVYQFQIEPEKMLFSENAVIDGGKVVGQSFTMSAFDADTVTIKNPSSKLNIPFVETERAIIAKFVIKAGDHDVLIKRIRLTDAGSINDEHLKNFRLTVGSEEISLVEHANLNVIDFFTNDYLLEKSQERTFTVLADILSPRIDSNIRLILEDGSDIYAYDVQYGFGTRVDNQFNRQSAWCLGSNTTTCPSPGLRKYCSREDVENHVIDCVTASPTTTTTGGTTTGTTTTAPPPPAVPPAPAVQLPLIFGFSQPADVLNPGVIVETFIKDQARHGITEIPIFLGGNVTPDGTDVKLGGVVPNLSSFMTMLARVETALGVPAKTLKIRPYIRASLTAEDAAANPNGPGKISLNNATTRQNLKTLIQQIAAGQKYGLVGDRIEEATLDFEDITASNFDPADLAAGDEGSVTQIASFTQELRNGFGKKLGVYCTGFLDPDWFPAATSPFAVSPRNFISEADAEILFKSGVDVIEIGAYSTFPQQGGAGGFADPAVYGPIHSNYRSFLGFQYEVLSRIAIRNPSLSLGASKSLRIDIPVFTASDTVTIVEAVGAVQNLVSGHVTTSVKGAVFDFGSLDDQEKTLIFGAENP